MPKSMQMYIFLGLKLSYPGPYSGIYGILVFMFKIQHGYSIMFIHFLKAKDCHDCHVEASIPRTHER